MADFGGYQMLTPQEVQAQLAQQRRQAMLSGNVNVMRAANMESALDGLFGNPQLRQAQRMQTRMQTAQQQVPQQPGEDDLDYELRRLKAMRDAAASVDPAVASQINSRILELGEAKLQRSRLKAADTRAQEAHDLDVAAARDDATMRKLTGGNTYVLDRRTGAATSFDLLDPAQSAEFAKAAAKPGVLVITPDQAFQLYHNQTIEAMKVRRALAESDGLSKVTAKEVERAGAGLFDLYATADRIFQVLEQNPDVLTATSAGAAKLDKLATEMGAAGRAASGGKTAEGQSIDEWLKANSITNTRAQGLVVGLAYATARANDPTGRISDKDLAAAMEMVGGNNPNPAAIIANLNDNLMARSQGLFDRIDYGQPVLREQFAKMREGLGARSKSFNDRLQKYSQGQLGPGTTGLAPAATDADDIEAIIKKYPASK